MEGDRQQNGKLPLHSSRAACPGVDDTFKCSLESPSLLPMADRQAD